MDVRGNYRNYVIRKTDENYVILFLLDRSLLANAID